MPADTRPTPPPCLSICMIVKNEAALLERCLKSVRPVADEIIVVDTGSTDNTAAIAGNCGAKVFHTPWQDDFSAARNVSIEHASGVWILWLDADDVVPATSLPIFERLKMTAPDRVYGCVVRNERPGGTGTEFNQARLFPNRPELRFERRIHEQIMPSALRAGLRLEPCDAVVEHHGYVEPEQVHRKAQRNVRLLLREFEGEDPDIVTAIEIADSCTLMEEEKQAAKWYRYACALPGVETNSPVLMAHASYGLGVIANKHERFTEAINLFDQALRLTPWRTDILYSMAVAAEGNGDNDEAVNVLKRIFTVVPQVGQVGVDFRSARIKAYLRLTRILVELQRLDEAVSVIREAATTVPSRPEIHSMAGKVYCKNGDPMAGLHAFEKSIHLRRDGNFDAFIGLCCIYRLAGREDTVRGTLDAIAPMFGSDRRYHLARWLLTGTYDASVLPNAGENGYEEERAFLKRSFLGLL